MQKHYIYIYIRICTLTSIFHGNSLMQRLSVVPKMVVSIDTYPHDLSKSTYFESNSSWLFNLIQLNLGVGLIKKAN